MNGMNYGDIVKKAWHLTWRHRALWILGLFAGISGWSSGGGGGSGGSSWSTSSSDMPSWMSYSNIMNEVYRLLPIIVAVFVVLLLISLLWWVLGIAARGGLVDAVNEIEEGRPFRLRESWEVGFDKFWRLLGLSLLLKLPILILALALLSAVFVPLLVPLMRGIEPSGAIVAPMCGALVIGVPVLLVASLVLEILYLVAMRFIMLYDMRVMRAVGEAWRAFRARLKDHLLMWLMNLGLNIAAAIVLAIPAGILAMAIIIPGVLSARSGRYEELLGMFVVLVIVFILISLLFVSIWGTFTSALWTIFFRRLVGFEREPVAYAPPQWDGTVRPTWGGEVPPVPPAPSAPAYAQPAPPAPPTPPVPPVPPVGQNPEDRPNG